MDYTFSDDSLISQNRDAMATEMDGETVMMSIQRGTYFSLNGTGGQIWKLLAEPITVAALEQQIREQYCISQEVCRSDVREFLEHLSHNDLLTIHR